MRKLRRGEQLPRTSRFKLLLHLASGGMGTIFVGCRRDDPDCRELVAVKRAHSHLLDDSTFRKMLVAEAQLASRLLHRHVVDVKEVDEAEGELLLIMDYIEGGSLSELTSARRRQGKSLPGNLAIRAVVEAGFGIHQAHVLSDEGGRCLGLIHRDVSPQNILVGTDGIARLADFGIAKAVEHDGTNTHSGVLKGKCGYMAPEYVRDRIVSPQLDIFALGVVAWELLAGQRLFRGTSDLEKVQSILSPDPCPRLRDLVDVPQAIDDAVAKALAKDPDARWDTALGFAFALDDAARAYGGLPTTQEVARFVEDALREELAERRVALAEVMARRDRATRAHERDVGSLKRAQRIVKDEVDATTLNWSRQPFQSSPSTPPPSVGPALSEVVGPPSLPAPVPIADDGAVASRPGRTTLPLNGAHLVSSAPPGAPLLVVPSVEHPLSMGHRSEPESRPTPAPAVAPRAPSRLDEGTPRAMPVSLSPTVSTGFPWGLGKTLRLRRLPLLAIVSLFGVGLALALGLTMDRNEESTVQARQPLVQAPHEARRGVSSAFASATAARSEPEVVGSGPSALDREKESAEIREPSAVTAIEAPVIAIPSSVRTGPGTPAGPAWRPKANPYSKPREVVPNDI